MAYFKGKPTALAEGMRTNGTRGSRKKERGTKIRHAGKKAKR